MRTFVSLLIGFSSMAVGSVLADQPPRGSLLELHSCELYAGGCVVSSEATLGGRYMLRAWNFSGGGFGNVDFNGLQVALLQSAAENLASPAAGPGEAVVYLPAVATPIQRDALLAWIKSSQPAFKQLKSRVVPMQFAKTETGYRFAAGNVISVSAASLESCETGACGEALWYTPRSATTAFTVAVDRVSRITEPLLQLKWDDAGKRSVFLAKFGGDAPQKSLYISSADWCSPSGKLF